MLACWALRCRSGDWSRAGLQTTLLSPKRTKSFRHVCFRSVIFFAIHKFNAYGPAKILYSNLSRWEEHGATFNSSRIAALFFVHIYLFLFICILYLYFVFLIRFCRGSGSEYACFSCISIQPFSSVVHLLFKKNSFCPVFLHSGTSLWVSFCFPIPRGFQVSTVACCLLLVTCQDFSASGPYHCSTSVQPSPRLPPC